jgi:hypothetical protein
VIPEVKRVDVALWMALDTTANDVCHPGQHSIPSRLEILTREASTTHCSAPREPVVLAAQGKGRMARSTMLESILTRPSLREDQAIAADQGVGR